MKRLLFILLFLPTALLVLAFYFRVPLVEKSLALALEVPVSIEAIDLSKNGAVIKNLKISNPPGSKLNHAFTAKEITIQLNHTRCWEEKMLVIDTIMIDKSVMGVEFYSASTSNTNWSKIATSLAKPSPIPISLQLIVENLAFNNLRLFVEYHGYFRGTMNPRPIPSLVLKNIGSNQPMNVHQFMLVFTKLILNQAANSLNLNTLIPAFLIQRLIPLPIFQIEQAGSFIKNWFEGHSQQNND